MSDELAELARRLRLLEDKEAIRDVLYRNSRGIDRGDAELARSTYHADSVEVHWESFTGNGHDFSDFMSEEMTKIRSVSHFIDNPLIEVDGDRAFCESYYLARNRIDRDPDLGGWVEVVVWGRYLDVLERREGVWRIAHRRLAKDGDRMQVIVAASPLAKMFREPAAGSQGRTGREDPSYLGYAITEQEYPPSGGNPGIFDRWRRVGASD